MENSVKNQPSSKNKTLKIVLICMGGLIAFFVLMFVVCTSLCVGGVGLAALGAAEESEEGSGTSTAPVAALSATELISIYKDNEVAADNNYKGKWIQVSGKVASIEKDFFDIPHVNFSSEGDFEFADVRIYFADNSGLASLKKGQDLTIIGRCEGMAGDVIIRRAVMDDNKSSEAVKSAVSQAAPVVGTFTDSRDGKKYRTVKIGNTTWMAENLNFNAEYSSCYEEKDSNCQKYGRLYAWETAMKACPSGWRLPANTDWNDLIRTAGGTAAGKKLMSKTQWNDGAGTDDYGFSALPGGMLVFEGVLISLGVGSAAQWWSATKGQNGEQCFEEGEWCFEVAHSVIIGGHNNHGSVKIKTDDIGNFSVRCVKN